MGMSGQAHTGAITAD